MITSRHGTRTPLPALLTLALALVACGGATAESAAGTPPPDTTSDAPAASQPPASEPGESTAPTTPAATAEPQQPGEMGSFTVDDITFAVTMLNRCIPFSESETDIDLQALATGAQLNLYLESGQADVSVQGSAVEDLAGSDAFGSDVTVSEFSAGDGRFTGSATAFDSRGNGASVDLTWDVEIPDEIRDCSL